MGRRHRQGLDMAPLAGDPGKDLFAYLFLLIMVFAFMLLMSGKGNGTAQTAPDQPPQGKSSIVVSAAGMVAELVEKNGGILLQYPDGTYDPRTDFHRLMDDERIVTGADGTRVLYVKNQDQNTIGLSQYLEAFKELSGRQVSIAFAEVLP